MPDRWIAEYAQILENKRADGTSDGNVLADIKTGVIENLRYVSTLMYASNLNYSVDAVNAGVVKFRQAAFLQLRGYSYQGDNVAQHLSTRSLDVIVDTPLSLFYDLIDMDLVMLRDSSTLTAQNIGSIVYSFNNTMECEWLDMLITCSYATGNVIEIDYTVEGTDQARLNWKMMQLMVNTFKQQFNAFTMGVNTNEMRAIVSPRLSVDISQAFSAIIGTSEAFSALQRDSVNSFKLMGLEIIESTLLDALLDNGTNQSPYFELRGYDFTGIQAVICHPYASTMPFQFRSVKSTIMFDTGFDRIIHRWKYGKGILYPNVVGVVKDKNADGGTSAPLANLVDTIAGGTISGQEAVAQAMAGNKIFHRYQGEGTNELITQLKNAGVNSADAIKARFYTYANGRLTPNNVSTATPLSSVITVKALGELADNTADTIIQAAVTANAGLDATEIEVTGTPTTTGATISAKAGSAKYNGSVAVTFTVAASLKK